MEQEIALVEDVLDARRNAPLMREAIERAGVRNHKPFKSLIGMSDAVAIVDRPVHPAGIARGSRERQSVARSPGRHDHCLSMGHLRDQLAFSPWKNWVRDDLRVGERQASA